MMSAIPPNITKCGSDVRFVPKADVSNRSKFSVGEVAPLGP